MNPMDAPVTFGEWVRIRRRKLDLTQSELADRAGCSVFALRKIESGERRPSKQLANLLAKSLEISPDELPQFLKVARGELSLGRLGSADPGSGVIAADKTNATFAVNPLPTFGNLFIGRNQEILALSRLLADPQCSLLTLIGPGGIGKTRLAVESAAHSQQFFSDGVYFVPLAALQSPSYIVPAIADTLGISFHGHDEPLAQLIFHLQGKHILLVLDNVEHLLARVSLFGELLAGAPTIKLLVTSRERLNLQQEWVFEIQGLPAPSPSQAVNSQEYSSVQLFIQAARRTNAAFEADTADLADIAHICRMLDGMPLGIELAAAWVSVLTCSEIASEMERSFDFLATKYRNIPERQRSLRAAFDYSWNLLEEEEKNVLARLSVFHGGFERPQAEQIAGASLSILQALVTKSLIKRKSNGRFDLHEVIRQYAYAHLEQSQEYLTILEKHAAIYLDYFQERSPGLKSAQQFQVIRDLRLEMNNLRAAWNWMFDNGQFERLGANLRSLGWYCDITGLLQDGVDMLGKIREGNLTHLPEDHARRIKGMASGQLGLIIFRQGDFDRAMQLLEESLWMLRPFGDPDLLTDPLIILGVIHHLLGQYDRSRQMSTEGLVCARNAGSLWWEGYAIFNLGYYDSLMGEYASAFDQMWQAVTIWRQLGDFSAMTLGLNHLCPTAIYLGKTDELVGWLNESIELCKQVGDIWGLGTAYRHLGLTMLAKGDPDEAIHLIQKSLDLFAEITTGWDQARSNIFLAEAYREKQDYRQAQTILVQALRQAHQIHSTFLGMDALAGLALITSVLGENDRAYEMARFVLTNEGSSHFAISRAKQIVASLEPDLDLNVIQDVSTKIDRVEFSSFAL